LRRELRRFTGERRAFVPVAGQLLDVSQVFERVREGHVVAGARGVGKPPEHLPRRPELPDVEQLLCVLLRRTGLVRDGAEALLERDRAFHQLVIDVAAPDVAQVAEHRQRLQQSAPVAGALGPHDRLLRESRRRVVRIDPQDAGSVREHERAEARVVTGGLQRRLVESDRAARVLHLVGDDPGEEQDLRSCGLRGRLLERLVE
jgi:hypothetical protein